VAKGIQQVTVEYLEYGLIYLFTVKLVDLNGNKSLGSVIIVSLNRVVTDLNLAPYITAPVQDVLPDKRLITGTQYTGTVDGFVKAGGSTIGMGGNDGKFTIGIEYVAKATLTPNPGYTFASLGNDSFTYGGATVVSNAASGVMVITFPALGKAWYVANYGTDVPSNGTSPDTPLKTVNYALERIALAHQTPHLDWTNADIVVIGTSGDNRTILIDNDNANTYPPITLRGLSPSQPGILTAQKAAADWYNPTAANAYRVMEITRGAKVILGNDITITGGGQRAEVQYGAGVYVHDNGIDSPFIMNGGAITNNRAYISSLSGTGGGVYVRYTSAMIMNGGVISDNYSYRTGGVAATNDSTFTMTGGVITNNNSVQAGAGVRVVNGSSTFTMSGGVISANIATEGYSGGVYVGGDGKFIMSGGTVSGNTSPGSGGVWLNGNGIFVMDGGTISDNIAPQYGGGVGLVDTASFIMHGGIIRGNTAVSGGGGVAVYESSAATFKKEPPSPGGASGIIYGSNGDANSNTATGAAITLLNSGHAVYIAPEAGGPKSRETTVTAYQNLDSTAADGWAE
jgi:hypothetical protein